ncbi:hypothetical protein PoB_006413200 [Plakobranchus ocellatus]|uniref:Secreted protein n=1 Tax=Plakobranchus ocellatus TaxID=259542 RepID=A0AAV4D099_9GAST|nr:hypothetical protein PoB_006413200 [Plakobranchus ocellatus]
MFLHSYLFSVNLIKLLLLPLPIAHDLRFSIKVIICLPLLRGVGGTVACESALRSAGTLLSRVRAPPSAPRPVGGPKSLRSPCCGLAIYKKPKPYLYCVCLQSFQ